MKTAKFSRSESESITFRVPLSEILERHLTQEERDAVAGHYITAWSATTDSDDDTKDDDVIDSSFSKTREFKTDPSGQLVEQPRETRNHCAKKSDVDKLEAKIDEVAARTRSY